eukprot:6369112-Pyramimonas_sp.AAC.1
MASKRLITRPSRKPKLQEGLRMDQIGGARTVMSIPPTQEDLRDREQASPKPPRGPQEAPQEAETWLQAPVGP